jgi:peptidyl-prolyl cis-trans isomerase SurA
MAQIMMHSGQRQPEVIAQRRARAEEVMRQLRTGADFAKMAATYSDASDALQRRRSAGASDRLPPMFAEALKAETGPGHAHHQEHTALPHPEAGGPPQCGRGASRGRRAADPRPPHPDQGDADHERGRRQAQAAGTEERLDNKAAKFEDLARLVSNDGSASKGGDLGWLYPGDTMPEFETAMNN